MDNAWAGQAITAYAATFEASPAAYVARVWLGHQPVAAIPFAGFSRDTQACKMGIPRLVNAGQKGMVVVQRQGPADQGTLYVRMQLRTVSRGLSFERLDRGIAVKRFYSRPQDAGDDDDEPELRRHPHDARVLCLLAGEEVLITITVVSLQPRQFVALTDSLPAGLEVVRDPHFCDRSSNHVSWQRDQVQVYYNSLRPRVSISFRYRARAIVPGLYMVPPAVAEEMYAPEVYGRSAAAMLLLQ